ncbi:MAG: hypothetical protein J6T02_04050 [Bacteroidales bacterium]|nr:hypothetical protein [Bacteroidales bacterium]
MKKLSFVILLLIISTLPSLCCTSIIVTKEKSGIGRPVMLKHRDTSVPDSKIEMFHGEHYDFIGLVNSSWRSRPVAKNTNGIPEVWCGMNTHGFCLMNTASYNIKDDNIPSSAMDREGLVIFRALGICATIEDFENFIDTLSRPMGIEGNFGVIDAKGGAAYYEINNYKSVKYDVYDEPCGYMVVTNFSRSGREKDRRGVDRYEKASEIFAGMSVFDHSTIINRISRSGSPIMRDISMSSVVFEGAAEKCGEAVMWTCLGYPDSVPYIPLMMSEDIPSFMTAEGDGNAPICDVAKKVKASGLKVNKLIRFLECRVDVKFYMDYKSITESVYSKYCAAVEFFAKNH